MLLFGNNPLRPVSNEVNDVPPSPKSVCHCITWPSPPYLLASFPCTLNGSGANFGQFLALLGLPRFLAQGSSPPRSGRWDP